ncbi:hypothetical protein QSV04_03115 [Bifidobacterium longum]|uniref:EndoS/ChiA family endoglycosidase n=1 Tax=Bifidobacterium longum TaxID=216816 RepID=UPI002570DD62|nr:hypothetical protein [Bifidobacterium longum]MDL5533064.1 hypothetical protein [Bifidobacterium longum]
MVYYRAWRDVTMKGVNTDLPDDNWISMYDIPYGIDVVNVFSYVPSGQEAAAQPFYDKLKSDYAPYLHARGIKTRTRFGLQRCYGRRFQDVDCSAGQKRR